MACGSSAGPAGPGGAGPPRATVRADVEFCAPAGEPLVVDLYFPAAPADVKVPVALFFHGGAWIGGTENLSGSAWLAALVEPLRDRGFLVASAEYRLAPAARWPAPIEDAKCAVRFLRSRAAEYGLDPDRILAWGSSAGGHLASLVGTTEDGELEGNGGHAGVSSRVSAVVDLWGPADLSDPTGWPIGTGAAFQLVFRASSFDDPVLVEASPVAHVDPGDPPFLIVHGLDDDVVPVDQSYAMRDALRAVGVDAELITVANAGHGLVRTFGAGPLEPSADSVAEAILAFFEARTR